jgi:CRISPR-associated exonuclease Cas4
MAREPNLLLLAAGLVLSLIAIILLWRGRQLRALSGLPAGAILADDMGVWRRPTETLVARDLKLAGKPDYVVAQHDGALIPVEVKSRPAPAQPFESHVLQLAAYCLLVERHYQVRPPHGIIQYEDRAFSIPFSNALEEDLLDLLADMREDLYASEADRPHEDPWRCRSCGFESVCDQSLA